MLEFKKKMGNSNSRNSKNCTQEIIEISHFGELAPMHARIMEILVSSLSLHPEKCNVFIWEKSQ